MPTCAFFRQSGGKGQVQEPSDVVRTEGVGHFHVSQSRQHLVVSSPETQRCCFSIFKDDADLMNCLGETFIYFIEALAFLEFLQSGGSSFGVHCSHPPPPTCVAETS